MLSQEDIIKEYNEILRESQNIAIFTRGIEIQKEEMENLIAYNEYLEGIKQEYIQLGDEEGANLILCLQCGADAIKCELLMLMNLKQDKMADAWDNLIEAQNLVKSVIRNHPVDGSSLMGYMHKLHAYEKTLFPRMMFASRGSIVIRSKCSICDQAYGECDHMKGKFYMGKMCCRMIEEEELEEISTVENPADKRCRTFAFGTSNGEFIDALTLRKQDRSLS